MAKASEIEILLAMVKEEEEEEDVMEETDGASIKKILEISKLSTSSVNLKKVLLTLQRGIQEGYVVGDDGKYKLAFDDECPESSLEQKAKPCIKPKPRSPKTESRPKPQPSEPCCPKLSQPAKRCDSSSSSEDDKTPAESPEKQVNNSAYFLLQDLRRKIH